MMMMMMMICDLCCTAEEDLWQLHQVFFTSWLLLLLVGAVKVENFPQHLKNELQKLQNSEDMERQLQEIERNTCKVGSLSQAIKRISVPPPGRNFRDGRVIRP